MYNGCHKVLKYWIWIVSRLLPTKSWLKMQCYFFLERALSPPPPPPSFCFIAALLVHPNSTLESSKHVLCLRITYLQWTGRYAVQKMDYTSQRSLVAISEGATLSSNIKICQRFLSPIIFQMYKTSTKRRKEINKKTFSKGKKIDYLDSIRLPINRVWI